MSLMREKVIAEKLANSTYPRLINLKNSLDQAVSNGREITIVADSQGVFFNFNTAQLRNGVGKCASSVYTDTVDTRAITLETFGVRVASNLRVWGKRIQECMNTTSRMLRVDEKKPSS